MLTFHINLYCPKAYHRPDHSIRIVEYHRKIIIINHKPKIFTEFRTQDSFGFVTLVVVISSPKQCCSLRRSIVLSFRATETIFTGNGTQDSFSSCDLCFCNLLFETNNFGLGAVLLSCLVSELQETPSPGNELRTLSGVLTLLCFLPGLKE
jgi:hypothetical protein